MKRFTFALVLVAGIPVLAQSVADAVNTKARAPQLLKNFEQSPLTLEVNRGQAPQGVDFVGFGLGHKFLLSRAGARVEFSGATPNESESVELQLVSANPASQGEGLERVAFSSAYFTAEDPEGRLRNLPNYAKARYRRVWPGVDIVYYGNRQRLEYDMIVAPGGDPNAIRMRVVSNERFSLTPAGDLSIHTRFGDITQHRPLAYQTIDGRRRQVLARYVTSGSGEVGIALGKYDRFRELVIDPVLTLSNLPTSNAGASAVAVDSVSGNMYIAGGNGANTYVLKLNPNAQSLALGVFQASTAGGIAVDSNGFAYVTGSTNNSSFFTTNSSFPLRDPSGGATDAFFMVYDPDHQAIPYSQFLGGVGNDTGNGIAIDQSVGHVVAYITGTTAGGANFPTTAGTPSFGGGASDAFVAKIDPTLSGTNVLLYSTFVGGSGGDGSNGIAVVNGKAYIGGFTASPSASFLPSSATGYNTSKTNTNVDGFIEVLNTTGTTASYLTFLPLAPVNAISVDSMLAAYVTGAVDGTSNALVTTSSGFQLTNGGSGCSTYSVSTCTDAFLSKYDTTMGGTSSLLYSSYLGGNLSDAGFGVIADNFGNAYVVGRTNSSNFPTVRPIQATYHGGAISNASTLATQFDAFAAKFNTLASGTPSLVYSTYLGGSNPDQALATTLDVNNTLYVAGITSSTDFPTNPPQTVSPGTYSFISKIIDTLAELSIKKAHTGNFTQGQQGATYTITVTNSGSASTSGMVTVTDTVPSGETLVSMSGTGWTCSSNSCSRSDALSAGTAYPTITVTVNVSATASSPQVNQASASGGGAATVNANDSTIINQGPAVLTITKSHMGNFTQGQQNASYTVTVANTSGAGPTAGTVTMTEMPPTGMTVASMSGTGWTCNTSTCTRSDALTGGQSYPIITVSVNVAFSATSPLVNQVSVSGGGAATANGMDSTTITPNPPVLTVTKTHTGNFTQGQQNATYTVTVSNTAGTGPTTGTVTVTDTLPSGFALVSMAGTGWTCPSNSCTRSDALNGGSSYPPITVTVNVSFSASSPQVNQVSVSGGGSANASNMDSTTVTPNPPVLTISKSHLGNFTQGQQNAAYTVTVTNTPGTGPTTGMVSVGETVPSGLTLVSMNGTGWICSSNTCSRSDVLNGGQSYPSITVTVNVASNASSPQVNQVAVLGGGSASASAMDSTNITTSNQPSLIITKTHTGNYAQGQQGATYTITVSNAASAGTTSGTVTVTDTAPSGLNLVSLAGTGWTCGGNQCSRSDALAPGASYPVITATVNVASSATSPQVNQVSATGGGSPTVNASDSTTIVAGAPVLSITKTHTGNFSQSQTNATYTVTVSNAVGAGPTSGTVTVADTLPSALTLVSMSGTGWTCVSTSCTRSDALAGGASYPAITVTVSVAANATSPQVNQVSVSGGGSASANTSDSTTIGTNSPTLTLNRPTLNFGFNGSLITSQQTVTVLFTGGFGVAWTASSNQSNITVSPTSGNGNGTFTVTATAGPSGTITVTAPGATGSPKTVTVNVAQVTLAPPFGSFDTPTNNSTGLAGAIAVTGWGLDNVEVVTAGVWREPVTGETASSNGLVFIGNAPFVSDARPDVAASFPNTPFNYRAGFGYLLLTNFLPNNNGGTGGLGNGTYKLHMLLTNKAGMVTDLGARTITVDNQHAMKPFGTIDTPGQGDTISGASYVNFGWALTQQPFNIPIDGSTVLVFIDGVQQPGHATYNNFRSDIATLFPGYANSNGAIGFYVIDTTKLSNSVHTIFWIVTDSGSRADGLGSRYMTVFNSGGSSVSVPEPPTEESLRTGVRLRQGYDRDATVDPVIPDDDGTYTVNIQELGRIELTVGASRGYMQVGDQETALPIGSTLKGGVFYWQPPVGFLGEYSLVFERPDGNQLRVKVRVQPKRYALE